MKNKMKDKMCDVQVISAAKIQRPGKKINGKKYASKLEEYDEKIGMEDNYPAKKPADIAQAIKRSKNGYSSKPRVKPEKKKMR